MEKKKIKEKIDCENVKKGEGKEGRYIKKKIKEENSEEYERKIGRNRNS